MFFVVVLKFLDLQNILDHIKNEQQANSTGSSQSNIDKLFSLIKL